MFLLLYMSTYNQRKPGVVDNLLINEAVEWALQLTQPPGLILCDLGKLHVQSRMCPTKFKPLTGFLKIQTGLNLLGGYSYLSSPDQTLYMDFHQSLNSASRCSLIIS